MWLIWDVIEEYFEVELVKNQVIKDNTYWTYYHGRVVLLGGVDHLFIVVERWCRIQTMFTSKNWYQDKEL